MNRLEMIIGTHRYRQLNQTEVERILELLDANPVFNFLLAGIMAEKNWRRVLGEAYIKYVEAERPRSFSAQPQSQPFAKKENSHKEVIFGVGSCESTKFTTTKMM